MSYSEFRRKIIDKFPIIKKFKRYNLILPIILEQIIWPLFKPKKIYFDNRVFFTSVSEQSKPSRNLFAYKKIYNSFEKQLIEKYLAPGSNCIDIGANIGFFSYVFLKKIGQNGKIFSFESIPKVFSILKKNFKGDKNVYCFLGVVGNKQNDLIIDNMIDEKIDFIKIDIDGADYYALKSCQNIIARDKPKIIIEMSEASEIEHGIHYNKTIEFLVNNNYKLYEVDKKLEIFDRELKKNEVINLFAFN